MYINFFLILQRKNFITYIYIYKIIQYKIVLKNNRITNEITIRYVYYIYRLRADEVGWRTSKRVYGCIFWNKPSLYYLLGKKSRKKTKHCILQIVSFHQLSQQLIIIRLKTFYNNIKHNDFHYPSNRPLILFYNLWKIF